VTGAPERRALLASALAVGVLLVLIYIGSDRLQNFDTALVGYAVGAVFAFAGLVYRYTLWLTRPPTSRYFRAGWRYFFSWSNFRHYMLLVPRAWWTDILAQTFILRRGLLRWAMHMSIFWGVILSLLITVPLTFGWFRFTLIPPDHYRIWFFGVRLNSFPLETALSWVIFHGLDFTAALLLAGIAIAFWRRVTDAGLLTTQSFGFDLLPLVLLFGIAVTGLALTGSSLLWDGRFYWFISLTHQLVVVGWLLVLPFGKFFHIVERPATIGVTLYQTVNQRVEEAAASPSAIGGFTPGRCRACGEALPSAQFIQDVQATLSDLGQSYALGSGRGTLQDYCPTCKRKLRGRAYYRLQQDRFL
jgi:hypothetical protein